MAPSGFGWQRCRLRPQRGGRMRAATTQSTWAGQSSRTSRSTRTAHEGLARTNRSGINRPSGNRNGRTRRHAGARRRRSGSRWPPQFRKNIRVWRNYWPGRRLSRKIRLSRRTQGSATTNRRSRGCTWRRCPRHSGLWPWGRTRRHARHGCRRTGRARQRHGGRLRLIPYTRFQ